MIKYKISKDELNGLLFMYYGVLYGLDTSKGLQYKSFFNAKKDILKCANEIKNKNLNINDYIIVEEGINIG